MTSLEKRQETSRERRRRLALDLSRRDLQVSERLLFENSASPEDLAEDLRQRLTAVSGAPLSPAA